MLCALTLCGGRSQLRVVLKVGRRVAAVVLNMYVLAILRHHQPGLQLHFSRSVVVDRLDGGGNEHEAGVV